MDSYKKYYNSNKPKILAYRAKRRQDPEVRKQDMLRVIKCRAEAKNLEFNLKAEDLVWPTHCPLLEIEICYTNNKNLPNSPSVDRKDSSKGYTKDNCWVISNKANTIKNDATPEELTLLAKNLSLILSA